MATAGAYVAGHERPSVARKYREYKTAALAEIRAKKAAKTKLPPHFGRGADTPIGESGVTPKGQRPHFGRGGMNGVV